MNEPRAHVRQDEEPAATDPGSPMKPDRHHDASDTDFENAAESTVGRVSSS